MRNVVLFILLFLPLLMNGQSFFTDGMKWRTQIFGTQEQEPVAAIEVVTIERTPEDNCFDMFRSYEDNMSAKELIAVIRTEESKIFFQPKDSKNSEWYLMYNFGLKQGEGCFIYSPLSSSENSVPVKTYIKCVSIDKSSEYEVLLLEEYADDSCSNIIGRGSWIKGLSSLNGFLYNNRFEVDGFSSRLLDVSDNERILYTDKQSCILETTGHSIPDIKIDGLDVYISVDDEICGSLYFISGELIGKYKFSQIPAHIVLPDRGIYVLQVGKVSRKIMIY